MSVTDLVIGQALTSATDLIGSLLLIVPQGRIGDIPIMATLEEQHQSQLHVTEHPVQQGADITDHSFVKPKEIVLRCGWSNSSPDALQQTANAFTNASASSPFNDGSVSSSDYVGGIYSKLVNLQESRAPFDLLTTLKSYPNMLITSIAVTRDQKTSQALMCTIACRQVILVTTQSTILPPQANHANPANTAETINVGPQSLQTVPVPQFGVSGI